MDNAYRMIEAAKKADADAAKFQWTSDKHSMSQRRNDYEPKNYEILAYPFVWLDLLKKKCDEVGIEFMVTVFLEKDIYKIDQFVKRFKVASAESSDEAFIAAHEKYDKPVIISYGFGSDHNPAWVPPDNWKLLHCVVSYPTPVEQLNLGRVRRFDGLSDHTTSTLTGALAVSAGASVIEKHIRLYDTPPENPDFSHSLIVDGFCGDCLGRGDCHEDHKCPHGFSSYVGNIREAELALGSGENRMMECERVNLGRRVKP